MTTEPRSQASQRGSIPADSFANRLMLARAHAGHLSIREAADLCDLGRGAWTNWEKGARPADIIDIATVVAEKLNVDRDWLLFGGQLAQSEGRPGRRIRRSEGTEGMSPNHRLSPRAAKTPRPSRKEEVRRPRLITGSAGAPPGRTERPGTRRPVDTRPATRPAAA